MSSSANTAVSMTTIFTPPPGCSTSWTYEGSYYNSESNGLLIQNAIEINTRCFPEGFENAGRGDGGQVFSPGWCAVGYTSAAVFPGSVTTAICCPSDFAYSTTLTTPNGYNTVKIFAGCVSTYPAASTGTAVPARANNQDLTTSTVTGPLTMWAQPLTVAYDSEEMSLFTTPTQTVTPASSMFSLISTLPLSTGSLAPLIEGELATDEPGLSTGAKAGIGVGASVAGLLLIGLAIFLVRRFRKSPGGGVRADDGAGPYTAPASQPMAEMQGSFAQPKMVYPVSEAERGHVQPTEMQGSDPPRSHITTERQELPG